MTVSYTADVANGSSFGCFWKILGRWRGSVYKLVWRELIAYLFVYFVINSMYRLGMNEEQRRTFEKMKVYCSKQIESIPMSFVLGFYVTLIVKRWWDQYWILPMPDSLALYISASLHGQDERGRLLRRTIMRYVVLAYIICLQRISFRVKKRFPTLQHLVDTGLMTESEKKIFDLMEQKTTVLKFWMPAVWAGNLINRARSENRITSDHMVQTMLTELSDFRRKLGRIMVYDNVSVPLVYTQVVTLAVYSYFVAALIGRQWVRPPNPSTIYPGYELDLYFPCFLSLQFIFYIGWLKVAETLINPFGEDDDDFELNWLIDRHIKVSYMVVDEMHEEHPELLKDHYWEQVVPQDLPYNIASEHFRRSEPQGSTASLKVKPSESVYADLTSVKRHSVVPDEVYADYESVIDSPLPDSRKNWIQRQWSRVGSLRSTTSSSSRNRSHSHGHGPLPMSIHNSGHRPSLYERILSRRSSKENRNSSRFLPNRALNGTLTIAKEGNYTLMANPNSRPRVPTPDVSKENQMNLQSHAMPENKGQVPMPMPNRALYSNDASVVPPPTATNLGYGAPPPGQITHPVSTSTAPSPPQQQQVTPMGEDPLQALPPSRPISQREMLPPPYDLTAGGSPSPPPIHGGSILSPIQENEGSPYSTSSTMRSNRSSNYPTTASIFGIGRKPSPPPLDELPPIPTSASVAGAGGGTGGQRGSGSGSSSSSVKSEHSSSHHNLNPNATRRRLSSSRRGIGLDLTQSTPTPSASSSPSIINELESVLKETVFDGRINNAFEHDDDGDSSRDYMTISEVNESKLELERKLRSQQQAREVVVEPPPSLPEPRPVPGTFSIANGGNRSGAKVSTSSVASSGVEVGGRRSTTSNSYQASLNQSKEDIEADDGYDEKGSYNGDDEFNGSIIIPSRHIHTDLAVQSPQNNTPSTSTSTSTSASSCTDTNVEVEPLASLTPQSHSPISDSSNNNETVLLLSPKRKRKRNKDKEGGGIGGDGSSGDGKGGEGSSGGVATPVGADNSSLTNVSATKDCEVFV